MDLDDIWDAPLAEPAPSTSRSGATIEQPTPSRASPSKRRRTNLFLSSGSEDDEPKKTPAKEKPAPKKVPDIDALFDDLDDDGDLDLAPALDIEQLRKQADAKYANQRRTTKSALPDSQPEKGRDREDDGDKENREDEGEGKKKRKPLPKLDEARLIGPSGFPALVQQAKDFKPRGKGHEVSDLNRLLQVYQFWSHKMWPKQPFHETVQRVESLCHKKRMHNHLGIWRDQAKGTVNGLDPEDHHSHVEDDSSSDDESDKEQTSNNAGGAPVQAEASTSSPPPRPPSSTSEYTSGAPDDDFDIDAIIREEEERRVAEAGPSTAAASTSGSNQAQPSSTLHVVGEADDEAMWDALASPTVEPAKPPAPQSMDDDEDMWDIVRELEEEQFAAAKAPAPPKANEAPPTHTPATESTATEQPQPERRATNDEGWDEMYL